jgi:hypothetical protein
MPAQDVARRGAARQVPPGVPSMQQREELLPPQRGCRRRAWIAVTISSDVPFGERRGRRERSSRPAGFGWCLPPRHGHLWTPDRSSMRRVGRLIAAPTLRDDPLLRDVAAIG